MANINVQFADGSEHQYTDVPDSVTPEQITQRAAKDFAGVEIKHLARTVSDSAPKVEAAPMSKVDQFLALNHNLGAGMLKGASDIGSTLLKPIDASVLAIKHASGIKEGDYPSLDSLVPADRRGAVSSTLQDMGANPDSLAFKGGDIAASIAGTAGAGGMLGKGAEALGMAPKLINSLRTGGFSLGAPGGGMMANAATRISGGAIQGAAITGLVNPDDALAGAAIGGAIPVVGKLAGEAGKAIGKSFTASPEVAQLAQKAKSLGIDIPADRLANSKMLDATAASLNYVPFSGRIATETKMNNQIKTALSNTFGENTDNLSKDLIAKTQAKLGQGFDDFLTKNKVTVDQQLLGDLQGNLTKAKNELSADNYKIIENQVKDLLGKIDNGSIDGQAAYNVKKTLDRLGRGNGNEAFHAKQVRDSLMNSVLRSTTPDEASAFTALKRQYANLKTVEKLAGNTAEGDISMARLGNLDSRNPEVSDIAKIAATFAKGRESPHGAMQRIAMGGGVTALGGGLAAGVAAPVVAGLTGGRLANMALNSAMMKKFILAQPTAKQFSLGLLGKPVVRAGLLAVSHK